MSFQRRLVGAVTAATVVTLGAAFLVIYVTVNHWQERQLDTALVAEAVEEASEAAAAGGEQLVISSRPGPAANDTGPLTKYAAIYDAGQAIAQTPTFAGVPPVLSDLPTSERQPFDLWFGSEHLRGVLVPIPNHPLHKLLLAAPRADLDGDATFLSKAMLMVLLLAVIWSAIVATWIVRRLTRVHGSIAEVARRVAAGDLTARVGVTSGDPELARLAKDVDDMIERLGLLVVSQQRFIGHAAHELRSPLTTLYGELQQALRRQRDASSYRATIEEALAATRHLKQLAEDLLALARIGGAPQEDPEAVSLFSVVREAIEEVRGLTSPRCVTVDLAGDDALVRGHPRNLVRLVRNLVENGAAHVRDGGRVSVRVHVLPATVELCVSDDGAGVKAAERERIFEAFYRGSAERASDVEGAGLGLAIVREIAQLHGGSVRLAETQTGATFVVNLPRMTEAT